MRNPPVIIQILLVLFIICISTKLGKEPTRGEVEGWVKGSGGKRGGRLQKKRTEKTLVEDSNPPSANAKWYWNEKAGRKEGHRAGEKRGAVVSACVFPEKELVGRHLEVVAKGKSPGRSEEATRR